jgi:hypothetical protein
VPSRGLAAEPRRSKERLSYRSTARSGEKLWEDDRLSTFFTLVIMERLRVHVLHFSVLCIDFRR